MVESLTYLEMLEVIKTGKIGRLTVNKAQLSWTHHRVNIIERNRRRNKAARRMRKHNVHHKKIHGNQGH